ncbi:MAG: hypothetical protein ACTHZ1_01570 [Sphingobacterium sp.]
MRGTLKGKLLFFICIITLAGCEDDDLSAIAQKNEVDLLQMHVWENQIEIDEQFTDNSQPVKYKKSSTLAFTETQYTHIIQNTASQKSDASPSKKTEEYWGDYQYSPKDSLITLHYTVGSDSIGGDSTLSRTVVVHARYKIVEINENMLTLIAASDSSQSYGHPKITFKPKNIRD